jgi:hypothetical protein
MQQQEDAHFLPLDDIANEMSIRFRLSRMDIIDRMKRSSRGNVLDLPFTEEEDGQCGALLRTGEFVLHKANRWVKSNHDGELSVGQIIDIADVRDIEVHELGVRFCSHRKNIGGTDKDRLVLLRYMPFVDYEFDEKDKPDEKTYPFLSPTLREVEMSCDLQWIEVKQVRAIAFVFQIDQVNECQYACSGIYNAFFIRYQYDVGLQVDYEQITLPDTFNPFWSPFGGESYSKRIWNSIASIKELCWRSMTSSKSQWDGRTKHVHFPGMNQECMQYITHMMKVKLNDPNNPLCEDKMSITKAKKVCHPNLSVSHKKRKYDVSLVRVVEEHELDVVRSILGSTFGVGG